MKSKYQEYKNEVGKDVLKTLFFFFVVVPLALFAIAMLIIG